MSLFKEWVVSLVRMLLRLAVCEQARETGPCSNYTIYWYYDSTYGDCSRFWYGGCDGNDNRFDTRDECRNRCVSPPGIGTHVRLFYCVKVTVGWCRNKSHSRQIQMKWFHRLWELSCWISCANIHVLFSGFVNIRQFLTSGLPAYCWFIWRPVHTCGGQKMLVKA